MLGRLLGDLWQRARTRRISGLLADGVSLAQQGRTAEAHARLERVVSLAPGNAQGHYWLGAVHGMNGDRTAAATHLCLAIAAQPDFAAAHADLGNVWLLEGKPDAAIRCYREALKHDPKLATVYGNLARALRKVGEDGAALECLLKANVLAPLADDAFLELVLLMLERDRGEEARALTRRQLKAHPARPLVHKAAGLAALNQHDPQTALQHLQSACEFAPPDADLWLNIGIALQELLRLDEALGAYAEALSLDGNFAPARWRTALVRLMQGDFERAWPDYEARHASADRLRREFPYPLWEGQPLHGKTILVHAEQGLGDEIMFASCLPEVIAQAELCIIECHPKLASIFQRSFPAAQVHGGVQTGGLQAWVAAYPTPSYQISAGSLPRLLRRTRSEFPRHRGYLRADQGRIEFWRGRLAALGPELKVGISWMGGTRSSRAALRSLRLDELLPVLRTPGVQFVNLQYTPVDRELDALAAQHGIGVLNWPEVIADYDETAALVCALDLVISVCTAIVHLGGALGRPVWVMAPYSPEWRYGYAGTGMPWYPSARIYRQPGFRLWDPVIRQVADDLGALTRSARVK